jgi:hypothetical protein
MTDAMHQGATRAAVLATAAIVALLTFVPAASGARDPIASGSTDLHMKKGFLRKLSNLEVIVTGLGAGAVVGNKVGLSVRDGRLDPTDVQGFLDNRGGFKLTRGERGVPVTDVTVNTVKSAVYAKIAKARMQLGSLDPYSSAREGFGANFKTSKLTLTAKAAKRISNRLGLQGSRRIDGGRVMSNAYNQAQPSTVTVLPQGSATFTGNAGTLAKFQAKGIELPGGISAIAPAAKPSPVSFQLPIVGGTLAPDASAGTVQAAGGAQILKKAEPYSPTMKLVNVQLDLAAKTASVEIEIGPTPPFPGATGRSALADIVMQGAQVVANPTTRTIAVTGAEAKLQAAAAATLNDVFNQPAPTPPPSSNFILGDPLGTFSMTVQAQ